MPASSIVWPLRAFRAIAAACAGLAAAGALAASLEEELPALRQAAERGQVKVLAEARARFAGHLLEPYLHYWMLTAQLERADPREAREFLERHGGTPLAEALRREWLKVLGAAREWDTFRAEYRRLAAVDADIACYAFQERLARGEAEVAAEARAHFLSAQETSAACDPVFAALADGGALAEEDIVQRVRALLLANQVREAKRANALLAPNRRLPERLLDQVAASPARFLGRHEKAQLLTHNERELTLFAIARLARQRPQEAAERLEALREKLGALAAPAWARVAYHAALAHHPRATEWFARAGDAPLGETLAAWKARAALRAGDWKEVLAAIRGLPPEVARRATWRYWRARALDALGEEDAARKLMAGLARERHFYGLLAAEALGVTAAPDWNGFKPAPQDLERVAAIPAIRRALALDRAGLAQEASREWAWATRAMDDRSLLAAAEIARQAGKPERAINTANRTVSLHDLTQRYPTPHRDAVSTAASQWGLDEAFLYSIIRQESRFVADARSRAGATGLMQLMPATARWVARQIPVKPYEPRMLREPGTNVRLGTYYFSRVLDALGHPVLATAAYNAGPGRARRWRDGGALEGAIYIETIPFDETRNYVKQVFANAWHYRHRLTGEAPSLTELVGTIPARDGPDSQPVAANIP